MACCTPASASIRAARQRRIVDGLLHTGERFEQQLAAARRLIDIGAQREAQQLLRRLLDTPRSAEDDAAVRLALSESLLLAQQPAAALQETAQIISAMADAPAAQHAHIVAALAILQQADQPRRLELARSHLAEADPDAIADRFLPLHRVARVLIDIEVAEDVAAAAVAVHDLLSTPALDPLLARQMLTVTERLIALAGEALNRGDADRAMLITWRILAGEAALPAADAADPAAIDLDPILTTATPAAAEAHRLLAEMLVRIARDDVQRRGHAASLGGYAIAVRVLMVDAADARSMDAAVSYVRDLGSLSRPDPRRAPGDELSTADRLQRRLAALLNPIVTTPGQQSQLAAALAAQLERFKKADDLATGLAHFITAPAEAAEPQFHGPLADAPAHAATRRLIETIADHYRTLGDSDLAERQKAMAPPDPAFLADGHRIALMVDAWGYSRWPADTDFARGRATVQRYAQVAAWPAAERALELLYASAEPRDRDWPRIELTLLRSTHEEARTMAAGRRLPDQLIEPVREALERALAVLEHDDRATTRQRIAEVGTRLVERYRQMNRTDLAEHVIAAMDVQQAALADWALWMRSRLAGHQGDIELERALAAAPDDPPALTTSHGIEFGHLLQLCDRFADSPYRRQAIDRVLALEATYRGHRAFGVATELVTGLQAADRDLAEAEAPAWRLVVIAMAASEDALKRHVADLRPGQSLDALLDESVAALERIAAFLNAHPEGAHVAAAQKKFVELATAYGRADAWPVAEQVVAFFAELRPDHRTHGYLDLLRAATYLGRLDREHGLSLLAWQPTAPAVDEDGRRDLDAERALALADGMARGWADDVDIAGRTPEAGERPGIGHAAPSDAPRPAQTARRGRDIYSYEVQGDQALAMIRQSEQAQAQRFAALRQQPVDEQVRARRAEQAAAAAVVRDDAVLAEQELRRQDEAADSAYAILIELARLDAPQHRAVARQARQQVLWLIGFFEGQQRGDRAIVLIERMLEDLPDDPARLALAYRALEAQMRQAAHRPAGVEIDWAWLNQRHERFEAARNAARQFAQAHAERPRGLPWARRARSLVIDSFETEAALAATISPVRAGGLRLRQARELIALLEADPEHPAVARMASRLYQIAERIAALGERDTAIHVLNQVPVRFPTDDHAQRAVLRIAQLYADNLASPLRAVETYQEYLALTGTDVSSQIFQIARNLAAQNRFVEALHVYGVFVDSFPRDPRAAEALLAIGQTHQANNAWVDAMVAYKQIVREYPQHNFLPQARLAIAECHINLSQWGEARRVYEQFVRDHSGAAQAAMARQRIEILKNLSRFQDLLADEHVTRNKDDAQFQIARIALERLDNPIKAIEEFAKVVADFPQSQWADNAQLEIGKALLDLGRLDEARAALLKLVELYPNSALADNALYLVGQSYENEAQRLAAATSPGERHRLAMGRQEAAYKQFQMMNTMQDQRVAARRADLRMEGLFDEADLQDAYGNFRFRGDNRAIEQFARIAQIETERESALQAANLQDRINDAYRSAAEAYLRAATDYPLGERTSEALLRAAEILETRLKDHEAAMATYQRIVQFFPASPAAEDAAWKVAQNHDRRGEHENAVDGYRDFIRKYPASRRVPDALFATAEALEQLGRWIEAMDAYETFRQRFAEHPRAQQAAEQVNWIKAYRR